MMVWGNPCSKSTQPINCQFSNLINLITVVFQMFPGAKLILFGESLSTSKRWRAVKLQWKQNMRMRPHAYARWGKGLRTRTQSCSSCQLTRSRHNTLQWKQEARAFLQSNGKKNVAAGVKGVTLCVGCAPWEVKEELPLSRRYGIWFVTLLYCTGFFHIVLHSFLSMRNLSSKRRVSSVLFPLVPMGRLTPVRSGSGVIHVTNQRQKLEIGFPFPSVHQFNWKLAFRFPRFTKF